MKPFLMLSVILLNASARSDASPPKLPVYSDEIRLVAELARRLPNPWFLHEASYERVKPDGLPEAEGLHLVLWELPKTHDEFEAGKGNRIHLYWMASGYSAGKSSREDKAGSIDTVEWHKRTLIVPRAAPATWPGFKTALSSALRAAESDPVFTENGPNAFVGEVRFDKIHLYTHDEQHGFYYDGSITDRLTKRKQGFFLRPWSHTGSKLEGGNGREYLIVGGVGNNDWGFTAVVPLKALEPRGR